MSERTQRSLLLVAALLLTFGVGLALRRARFSGVLSLTPAIAPRPMASVAVRFRGVTVTGYESGKEAWVVTAPVIETDQDRRTMRFTGGLKATLLDQGKPGAYLTSPSAAFTDQTKLDFTGGLEATLLQGGQPRATLSAPTASFDIKTRSFLAAGSILIRVKPPAKPVQGELPSSLGTLTITCTQLSYSVGTKQVVCSGKVKIVTEKGDEVFGRDLTLNIETRDFTLTDFQGIVHAPKGEDENEIL